MGKFYQVFFLLLLAIRTVTAYAQPGLIRGKIIDTETGYPVNYANVLNYSKHASVYSNERGEFELEAAPGDTLVFSAMGYFYQKLEASSDLIGSGGLRNFPISPQAYTLSEARIVPLTTYGEFRQRFINLDRPKTKSEMLAEELSERSIIEGKEAYEMALASGRVKPMTGMAILTPEERERLMLAGIIEKENVRNMVYRKFNPEVVKQVTGLTEDVVIIEFMVFCDFSDDYLLDVGEYNLMVRIGQRFEDFKRKRMRENGNPMNLKGNETLHFS